MLKFAIATGILLVSISLIGYGVQAQASTALRGDIQTSLTQQTASEAESLSEFVESGLDTLTIIASQVRETNAGIQDISQTTDKQADTARGVAALTDEVADIADKTSVETEQVAAAAEEQAVQVQEVSQRIKDLSNQITELRSELAAFKTTDNAGTGAPRASADGGQPDSTE